MLVSPIGTDMDVIYAGLHAHWYLYLWNYSFVCVCFISSSKTRAKADVEPLSPAASRSAYPVPTMQTDSALLPSKNVNISAININSITAPERPMELQSFVDSNDISILALSETKLDATIHPSLYSLEGFHAPVACGITKFLRVLQAPGKAHWWLLWLSEMKS